MASARKKAAEAMEFTDVVIEMLDARAPRASCNPLVTELRRQRHRPCLKILNKADLADPTVTEAWLNVFNKQDETKAVALSCKSPRDASRVPILCQQIASHRNAPYKPLRMMIMGIPNVGKSTLMNILLARRVSLVADEPAVTKSQQTHSLNDHMTLTDSPGLLWPKIASADDGLKLAAIHAIGRNATIEEEVAEYLASVLLARYPGLLASRYDFDEDGIDGMGALELVAKKRGCLLMGKGASLDLRKASMIFLTDYRSGKLGRTSLESPEPIISSVQSAHTALPATGR